VAVIAGEGKLMETVLWLIRHGQTEWNAEGRYTGQSDIPLNEHGRAQAQALAEKLQACPPEVIVSSDLQRARETAEVIATACQLPLYTDPRLREINQGVWEGLFFPEIQSRFAQEFAARQANPLEVSAPGGETVGEVQKRVLTAVAQIVQQYHGRRVAIVAHGLVLALIKAHCTDYPITQVWDLIPANAEVEEIFWVEKD
jgi:alpha-ribazole phosphatase